VLYLGSLSGVLSLDGVSGVGGRVQKKREEEAAREKELAEIFKVAIVQPKVPLGVDPESIVCEFFRHNQCAKGFKCKFSHDLSVERKGHKIDLYSDTRDAEDEGEGGHHQGMARTEEALHPRGGLSRPGAGPRFVRPALPLRFFALRPSGAG